MSYNAYTLKHDDDCQCCICDTVRYTTVIDIQYSTKWWDFKLLSIYLDGVWHVRYSALNLHTTEVHTGTTTLENWNKSVKTREASNV